MNKSISLSFEKSACEPHVALRIIYDIHIYLASMDKSIHISHTLTNMYVCVYNYNKAKYDNKS